MQMLLHFICRQCRVRLAVIYVVLNQFIKLDEAESSRVWGQSLVSGVSYAFGSSKEQDSQKYVIIKAC